MNFNETRSIIKNIKGIDVFRFKFLTLFKIADELGVDITSKWCNENDNEWMSSPNIKIQTAFEDCVRAELTATDTDIVITITLYRGDTCTGERMGKSCVYTLVVTADNFEAITSNPKIMINDQNIIEVEITQEIYRRARRKVEQQEIDRIKNLIDNAYNNLLDKLIN